MLYILICSFYTNIFDPFVNNSQKQKRRLFEQSRSKSVPLSPERSHLHKLQKTNTFYLFSYWSAPRNQNRAEPPRRTPTGVKTADTVQSLQDVKTNMD